MAGIKITDLREISTVSDPGHTHLIVVSNGNTNRLTYNTLVNSLLQTASSVFTESFFQEVNELKNRFNTAENAYTTAITIVQELKANIESNFSSLSSELRNDVDEKLEKFNAISGQLDDVGNRLSIFQETLDSIKASDDTSILDKLEQISTVYELVKDEDTTQILGQLREKIDAISTDVGILSGNAIGINDLIGNAVADYQTLSAALCANYGEDFTVSEIIKDKTSEYLETIDLETTIKDYIDGSTAAKLEEIQTKSDERIDSNINSKFTNMLEQLYSWLSEESEECLTFFPTDDYDPQNNTTNNNTNSSYLALYNIWSALQNTDEPTSLMFGASPEDDYETDSEESGGIDGGDMPVGEGDDEESESEGEGEGEGGEGGEEGGDEGEGEDPEGLAIEDALDGYSVKYIKEDSARNTVMENGIVITPKFLYSENNFQTTSSIKTRFKTICPTKLLLYVNKNRILKDRDTTTKITIESEFGQPCFSYTFKNLKSLSSSIEDCDDGDFTLAFVGEMPEYYKIEIETTSTDGAFANTQTNIDLDSPFIKLITYKTTGVNRFEMYFVKGNMLGWNDVADGAGPNYKKPAPNEDHEYSMDDYNPKNTTHEHVDMLVRRTADNDFSLTEEFVESMASQFNTNEITYVLDRDRFIADAPSEEGQTEGTTVKKQYYIYPYQEVAMVSAIVNGFTYVEGCLYDICDTDPNFDSTIASFGGNDEISTYARGNNANEAQIGTKSIISIVQEAKVKIINKLKNWNTDLTADGPRPLKIESVSDLPTPDASIAETLLSTIYEKSGDYMVWNGTYSSTITDCYNEFIPTDSSAEINISLMDKDSYSATGDSTARTRYVINIETSVNS